MLELKEITKDYPAGENTVHALKGISLKFRRSELVSILGPSGCGKTTMLNIIGGLDKYTDGDLLINGRSTKNFNDRDWDAYRNYSIGFVFQSYNLIPHQTVLQNVELALTLSGVSKAERKERAKKALEEVGLGTQLHKKPGEMSGGQMQRVAIARAIVNNPDIILADEPTGALDTHTGLQVMNILKEIAKNRLVVMVTHNPDLAETYSTRIISMLDGKITDDSNPLSEQEIQIEEVRNESVRNESKKKEKKPSMSWGTSFMLSLKNLFTKKGRTTLTAFAGSIGIIGIALIYSISNGLQTYIDAVQEETLSSYPLTINRTETNIGDIMEVFMNARNSEPDHPKDKIYTRSAIYDIIDAVSSDEQKENDLRSFRQTVEEQRADSESKLHKALNGVQYSYDFNLLIYTKSVDGKIIISDAQKLLRDLIAESMNIDSSLFSSAEAMGMSSSMFGGGMSANIWQEILTGEDGSLISPLMTKQYDLIYGSWPNDYNEVVLVVDENNEISDMTLYALGLESREEVTKILNAAMNQEKLEEKNTSSWTYEEICNTEFRVVLNSDCYSYDENEGIYKDLRETDAGISYLYDSAVPIKVSGIIRQKEDATASMMYGSVGYTQKLTEYVITRQKDSPVVQAQLADEKTDVLTGLTFRSAVSDYTDEQKEEDFRSYIDSLDDKEKIDVYLQIMSTPPQSMIDQIVEDSFSGIGRSEMEDAMLMMMEQQMSMDENDLRKYIGRMSDDDLEEMYRTIVIERFKMEYAEQIQSQMAQLSDDEAAAALDMAMSIMDTEQCAHYYDEIMEFSSADYDLNLVKLGYVDIEEPSSMNLYASSFENKDVIEEVIDEYNTGKDELEQIKYTDYIGLMMSSITTIINAITYVLIAFVAISLIVSSIMIGVITLISVQERTKEIGILRAIGASKRNVSNMFNAETMLIGMTSGVIGVGITYLLCIPINIIVYNLTELSGLKAYLPIKTALILILISILLSVISGFIPSRSAAKKDPVVALRTE